MRTTSYSMLLLGLITCSFTLGFYEARSLARREQHARPATPAQQVETPQPPRATNVASAKQTETPTTNSADMQFWKTNAFAQTLLLDKTPEPESMFSFEMYAAPTNLLVIQGLSTNTITIAYDGNVTLSNTNLTEMSRLFWKAVSDMFPGTYKPVGFYDSRNNYYEGNTISHYQPSTNR